MGIVWGSLILDHCVDSNESQEIAYDSISYGDGVRCKICR